SRRHLHQYNAGCFYLYIYVLP
ncbi:glycosyltransferase, partial [Neisseria gonorrhoeae]